MAINQLKNIQIKYKYRRNNIILTIEEKTVKQDIIKLHKDIKKSGQTLTQIQYYMCLNDIKSVNDYWHNNTKNRVNQFFKYIRK